MSKIDEVRKAMMEALKAGDKPRKEALSLLLSALKAKFIDKRADLTEEEENAVVYKEIKAAQETLDTLPADRTALIDECKLRMAIYSEFAPKLMGEDEVREGRERGARRAVPRRADRQGQGQNHEGPHAPRQGQGRRRAGQPRAGRVFGVEAAGRQCPPFHPHARQTAQSYTPFAPTGICIGLPQAKHLLLSSGSCPSFVGGNKLRLTTSNIIKE